MELLPDLFMDTMISSSESRSAVTRFAVAGRPPVTRSFFEGPLGDVGAGALRFLEVCLGVCLGIFPGDFPVVLGVSNVVYDR